MTWPTSPNKDQYDNAADDPAQARSQLEDLHSAVSDIISHVSALMQTVLAATTASAVLAALGIAAYMREHLFLATPAITAAGTDTYTATYGIAAYTTNMIYSLVFTNANTATNPTINLDTLGAKTIKTEKGVAVDPGRISGFVQLRYDGTYMVLMNSNESVRTYLIEDSTDIAVSVDGDNNIASFGDVVLPAKGIIELIFTGRIDNTAGATTATYIAGIKIGATYYYAKRDDNGTITYEATHSADAGQYREFDGFNSKTSIAGVVPGLDIAAQGIPSGEQTVEFAIKTDTGDDDGILKGTTTTTRLVMRVTDLT